MYLFYLFQTQFGWKSYCIAVGSLDKSRNIRGTCIFILHQLWKTILCLLNTVERHAKWVNTQIVPTRVDNSKIQYYKMFVLSIPLAIKDCSLILWYAWSYADTWVPDKYTNLKHIILKSNELIMVISKTELVYHYHISQPAKLVKLICKLDNILHCSWLKSGLRP